MTRPHRPKAIAARLSGQTLAFTRRDPGEHVTVPVIAIERRTETGCDC
jgi:hypothetical protein